MGQACSACEPRRVEDNFQEKKRSRLMAIPEKPPLKALQGFHSQADVERRERDISCKTPRMQLPDQRMGSEEIYVPKLKHRPDSAGGPPLESPRKESSLENGNIMIAPLDFIVTTMKGGLSVSSPASTPRGTGTNTPRDARSGHREKLGSAPLVSPRERLVQGTRLERSVNREPPGPFSPHTPRSTEETLLDYTQAQVDFSPQYPDMRYHHLLPLHGPQQGRPGHHVQFMPQARNVQSAPYASTSPRPPPMASAQPPPAGGSLHPNGMQHSPRILYQGSKVVYSIPGDDGGSK